MLNNCKTVKVRFYKLKHDKQSTIQALKTTCVVYISDWQAIKEL